MHADFEGRLLFLSAPRVSECRFIMPSTGVHFTFPPNAINLCVTSHSHSEPIYCTITAVGFSRWPKGKLTKRSSFIFKSVVARIRETERPHNQRLRKSVEKYMITNRLLLRFLTFVLNWRPAMVKWKRVLMLFGTLLERRTETILTRYKSRLLSHLVTSHGHYTIYTDGTK